MNPVGAEVGQIAILQPLLVNPSTYTIPALEYRDFKAILEEDVCTAETSKPGPYHSDMGPLPCVCGGVLLPCKFTVVHVAHVNRGSTPFQIHPC